MASSISHACFIIVSTRNPRVVAPLPTLGCNTHPFQGKRQRPETRDQRPETRDQRPETRVQSPESRVQSPESRVQSPESRVQRPESRDQSPESRESRFQNPESRIQNPESRVEGDCGLTVAGQSLESWALHWSQGHLRFGVRLTVSRGAWN